ncbi:hypothetical protein JXA63_03245 [Candidatus Woesebacteria bacterium]|nr:hypothetical protein [Candidatus Woesebacteria bacterium]
MVERSQERQGCRRVFEKLGLVGRVVSPEQDYGTDGWGFKVVITQKPEGDGLVPRLKRRLDIRDDIAVSKSTQVSRAKAEEIAREVQSDFDEEFGPGSRQAEVRSAIPDFFRYL